jgi:glycosyl hydrolase family 26
MSKRLCQLLLALLVLGILGGAAVADASGASPGVATRKVALGISMANDKSLKAVDAFTRSVGHAPATWSIWSNWGGTDRGFPATALLNGLKARGIVPVIIWQPANPSNDIDPKFRYSRIMSGALDPYIKSWAKAAKAWAGRVVVRFAPEMNGYWYPWGMTRFDNTPARFVAAWKHIWKIVRGPAPGGMAARNVKFLWSPYQPCGRCASYASIYPGDKFVDYAGFTAFNWGTPQVWAPMVKKYTTSMRMLKLVAPTKPIIVAETGSSKLGGDKVAWILQGYPAVYKAYPKIVAILYFNRDMRFAHQPNWLLTVPAGALGAYKKIVAMPRFQGALP